MYHHLLFLVTFIFLPKALHFPHLLLGAAILLLMSVFCLDIIETQMHEVSLCASIYKDCKELKVKVRWFCNSVPSGLCVIVSRAYLRHTVVTEAVTGY